VSERERERHRLVAHVLKCVLARDVSECVEGLMELGIYMSGA